MGAGRFYLPGKKSGSHHFTQFADAEIADFMHADQDRGADRQRIVANFADHRWSDFQCARQGRVILQLQFFNDGIQHAVGVVGSRSRDFFKRHNQIAFLVVY